MDSSDSHVSLTPEEVRRCTVRALVAHGATPESAEAVAAATAAAEVAGVSSHGLAYVPVYCEHLRVGKVDGRADPSTERVRPALLVTDARTGFAHPAIANGFRALVPLARETGIAALAIRNSYNCGLLGYHTDELAREGLVGIGFTNAPASIAPVGGNRPVIGTNPFAVSVPDGSGGLALSSDQSASVVAKSEVMKHAREGRPIPPGWALDADGQPTTDPQLAVAGTLVPAGGYMGVGIGLFVELMAAAASGATLGIDASPFSGPAGGPPRTGQFFIGLDAEASSGGAFRERITRLAGAFTDQLGVRLPGAKKAAARRKAAETGGISVPEALYRRVVDLGGAR